MTQNHEPSRWWRWPLRVHPSVRLALLTLTRPQGYNLGAGLDLWFLWVKFANNLSVLGLRQVVPLLLIGSQWLLWQRTKENERPEDQDLSRTL